MKKFMVINGIYMGRIFKGEYVILNEEERIWDCETTGRSYPIENVKEIQSD